MARTKEYRHFCPVARSLEVIGEKWSLLLVRDLLRGPQRFSDLLRYLGGITPKWLTQRLRELEDAGIVERDSEAGRREVWYRLTPKGRELAPVVEALAVWGIEHALRPPLPEEPIRPPQMMAVVVVYFNKRRIRLPKPATWLVRFLPDRPYTIRFDGERWSTQGGEAEADLILETTPEAWATFVTAPREERRRLAGTMQIEGSQAQIEAFITSFERKPRDSSSVAGPTWPPALRSGVSRGPDERAYVPDG